MPSRAGRDRARYLRKSATDAERRSWPRLRDSIDLFGTYFRRRVVLGSSIIDFYCFNRRLIIEVDGSQHGSSAGQAADAERTQYLERHGYRVLRFWNHQVRHEMDSVLDTITAALSDPHP